MNDFTPPSPFTRPPILVQFLRRVLFQQIGGADCRFAQDGRHFEPEIIVTRELQRGVLARQLVRRTAAAVTAAADVTDGRRVRALLTRRRGRRS